VESEEEMGEIVEGGQEGSKNVGERWIGGDKEVFS